MDRFDSRKLHKYAAYGRVFMEPGIYNYRISYFSEHGIGAGHNTDYKIVVKAGKKRTKTEKNTGKQHHVKILLGDDCKTYVPEKETIEIPAGDSILWFTPNKEAVSLFVAGSAEKGKDAFDSRILNASSIYMRTFLSSGTHTYANTHTSSRKEKGRVIVSAPKEKQEWKDALGKVTVVKYAKGEFSPSEVSVVPFSTVIWVVEDKDANITLVGDPIKSDTISTPRVIGRTPIDKPKYTPRTPDRPKVPADDDMKC